MLHDPFKPLSHEQLRWTPPDSSVRRTKEISGPFNRFPLVPGLLPFRLSVFDHIEELVSVLLSLRLTLVHSCSPSKISQRLLL